MKLWRSAGAMAGGEFVEDGAEAEDIGTGVGGLAFDLFGGHVGGDGAGFGVEAGGECRSSIRLMATMRPRRESRAFQTSPMPPLPIGESGIYGS